MQILEQDNIRLRALEPNDLQWLYRWENNSDYWTISETTQPFSKYVLKQYLETAHLDIFTTKQLRLIIEIIDTKQPIGCIDLFDFNPYHLRAGVGILIAENNLQNKGYATIALNLLCNYAKNVLLLHQLYCNILTTNHISIKLFQNANFDIIGTKKQWQKTNKGWHDEYLLQRIFE